MHVSWDGGGLKVSWPRRGDQCVGVFVFAVHHIRGSCCPLFKTGQGMSRVILLIYLSIEGLWPSQPHRVTSGLFTKSNLARVEYNTKHAHYISVKHTHIFRKLVFSVGIALVEDKTERATGLGEERRRRKVGSN